MNKKGFTLVELLAVVMILAVIIGIGATAIGSTQKKIVNQQYENIVSNILIKAEDWAHKNNFTINKDITVQELIDKGILVPEDGNIIKNPIDHTSMNCYIITVTYTKGEKVNGITSPGSYTAKIKEAKKC